MDSPHNKFNPDEHGRDDKTLPDGAGTPPPPSDDLSHDMLAPQLEAINDLFNDPTLIDERTTPEAKLVNVTIPGYAIKSILGAGGMGTVYRAVQESPQRLVALKVIRPGLASPNVLRRFKYESEALGRLQHECIGRIYDAGTTDDGGGAVPWFAMELIEDGLSIRDYVQQYRLTVDERLTLFCRVCEAVHHGHQKGVIHRDLKPDNILVTPEGVPKIIDFGVARSTDADVGVTGDRTDAGALIGTLQYMSPEQCRAEPDAIDVRTDVYALGVVLYELLCDQYPYDIQERALQDVLRIVQENEPSKPGTINRNLRGDVEVITLKALEKEASRRYQSALELEQDIERYLAGMPIMAVPPSAAYRLRKFVRRNRVAVLASMLLLAVGIVGLVASWQWSRADAARQERNRMVSELIDFYMVDHFNAISRLAGSQPARELIIARSLEYLDTLREDAADDPELQRILAGGLQAVGNNQWSQRMGNRGDLTAAITVWEQSMQSIDALMDNDPTDDRLRDSALRVRTLLFDAYRFAGRDRDAELLLAQMNTLLSAFDDRFASDAIARMHFEVYRNQAALARALEDEQQQLSTLNHMLDHARTAADRWPANPMNSRDLRLVHNLLGALHNRLGDHDATMMHYEAALVITQARLADEPENNTEQRDLMKQHRYIAEHLWTRGDRQEAIRRSRVDVLPAARRLVERNRTADGTTDARAETDLAQALQSHGQYLHYAGSSSEAIGPLMESRQIWNRLATNAPDVVTHPRDSARTGYMLALALIKTDESNAAVELLLEIDDALESPCAASPDNADLRQIRRMCRALSEKTRPTQP